MINRIALSKCCSWPIMRQSLFVAMLVGSPLNGINQGDAILSGGPVSWWKIALTYCVPFLVATYGAYSALSLSTPGTKP